MQDSEGVHAGNKDMQAPLPAVVLDLACVLLSAVYQPSPVACQLPTAKTPQGVCDTCLINP